ncbi:MAG TPA: Fic family protein [Anaerolineales bacterium]|nr:Fic family protein [Anaerolineales bacterium]
MDPSKFQASTSGKVIRLPQGYWAFVPATLPPVLTFSPSLVAALSDADRALGELKGLGGTLANPHLLIRPLARREAVLSSRIEGTRASLDDLLAYEATQLSFLEAGSDVREVHNYVRALEYGLERINTLPVSLRLIRELHARLMEGVAGKEHLGGDVWTPGDFRRSQNWIGPAGSTLETAPYVPPPVEEMLAALGVLENFIHAPSDLPPLLRLGLIHYQFEAIHPFLDGNGRVGRLLVALLLSAWQLLPQPLLYLSAYFESNRRDYYDLLLAVSQRAAWEDWLLYFLEGVKQQSLDAVDRISRLQALRVRYQAQFQTRRAPARLLRVIDLLFAQPVLTARQVESALEINFPSAQRLIDQLVQAGLLREITGGRRNRVYRADEVLKILESV